LIGLVFNRFLQAMSADGMSAFETIWKCKRRTEPIGAKSTFKFINVEDFHNLYCVNDYIFTYNLSSFLEKED